MRTLLDLLDRLADVETTGVSIFDRRGRDREFRSFAQVIQRARRVASGLRERGLGAGDLLFIQLPTSHAQIETFLAAIVMGATPCMLAPPRALGGLDVFRERLARLWSAFPGAKLLADPRVGAESGQPFWEPIDSEDGDLAPLAPVDPDSLAFVQLTSGSTRAPKAVRITHGAVVSNLVATGRALDVGSRDVSVGWLPLYHDMGLVGQVFGGFIAAIDVMLLLPETFVARPVTWLRIVSSVEKHVIATAPSFAYKLCVDSIDDAALAELDLSRFRVAGCGAERVRKPVLEAFADRFEPAGFSRDAWKPCFGMAEACLAVTIGGPYTVDGEHVGCGRVIPDTQVVIRDEARDPVPDGVEGEITVAGPGLCDGYAGVAVPSPIRDGWLYTGDRGYLRDGQLYVTGRLKDLIIVDGVNIDPDELEWVSDSVVDQRGARSAAFSVDSGDGERVHLVAEVIASSADRLEQWRSAILDRVASLFGFKLASLQFVRRGSLPKTSSGKLQRARVRELHLSGGLDIVDNR